MQQQVEEENKELKKKVLELEVAFHHIDWELEVLCEFLENKGLTYRVQVGAFRVKANADAMLKKLKDAGFKDAFIKTE